MQESDHKHPTHRSFITFDFFSHTKFLLHCLLYYSSRTSSFMNFFRSRVSPYVLVSPTYILYHIDEPLGTI